MGKITEELLRKRAEHNEGVLSTLEEISIPQYDIEKIENLDKYCRHLKILFIQNNLIEKLENLDKLRELNYLNLAVNNISMIENLEHCESLTKLDLTLNFIDLEDFSQSMKNLAKIPIIKELYLNGNPCTDWPKYKEYIIATVPQLSFIDGYEILKSDRIKGRQNYESLEIELEKLAKENIFKKEIDPDKDNPDKYSKEYRRKLYKELEEERNEKEREKMQKQKENDAFWYGIEKKEIPSVYRENGEIRVCNYGKYDFRLDEDYFRSGITTFELKLPKFMDTSNITVDLNPQYVRVIAKDKLTQLKFNYDINVENSTIQRSTTTGHLLIKCPIVGAKIRENANRKPFNEKKEVKKTKFIDNTLDPTDKRKNKILEVKNLDDNNQFDIKEADYEGIDLSEIPDLD